MSTLAHVFEAAGLATVALGSIGNHIQDTAPPRGLWCDFPLGRPLGKPNDADFQHRVLAHAFGLLRAPEPVVETFAESIHDDGTAVMSCELPPRHDPGLHPAVDEARGLLPAYERAVAKLGNRSGAGRVVTAEDIPAAVQSFVAVAEGTPWKQAGIPGIPARVAQDIRGYYETAALALAEHAPPAWAGARWFFASTEAGRAVMEARQAMADAGEAHPIWFYLAPGDM
ncbi:hypothetical protein [Candidatus Poriferisodalis sp.]|uniref:hypothetical protein n=1 Tax=Candidatus Poriferisodalis sp. TaxID=3101277 RepID=UPI003B02DC58